MAVLLSDHQMSTWSAVVKTHAELFLRLLGQLVPPTRRLTHEQMSIGTVTAKAVHRSSGMRTLSTRKVVSEEQDVTKEDANAMEGQRLEQDYAPEVV